MLQRITRDKRMLQRIIGDKRMLQRIYKRQGITYVCCNV